MRVIRVYCELYGKAAELCIGDFGKFRKYMMKCGYNDIGRDLDHVFAGLTIEISGGDTTCFIWLPKFSGKRKALKTLVHECVHVGMILSRLCNLPMENAGEAQAYLVDYFYGEFLRRLK